MITTHVQFGGLLPALTATAMREPRTAAEARRWCDEQNAATKKRREEDDAIHRRNMNELAALGAQAERFVGRDRGPARPAARRGAQASLSVFELYRQRNGIRAALPEERSSLCEATCFGGVEVCDGETACWSKRLEEKGAAQRAGGRVESVFELYARRNAQPAGASARLHVQDYDRLNAPRAGARR